MQDATHLKSMLRRSRNYLKLDYKLHLARSSRIADHCITHALSDNAETKWAEACDHRHDLQYTSSVISNIVKKTFSILVAKIVT